MNMSIRWQFIIVCIAGLIIGCNDGWNPFSFSRPQRVVYNNVLADPMLGEASTQPVMEIPEPKLIENGPKTTLIYTCRNARSEVLREIVEGFVSPEGMVQSSQQLNALIISDQKDLIPNLLKFVQEMDRPTGQVLVEARVVEISLTGNLEAQLSEIFSLQNAVPTLLQNSKIVLDTPGNSPNVNQGLQLNLRVLDIGIKHLDEYIRLLVSQEKAKILSSPNLIVAAGSEASIVTGEDQPFQTAQSSGAGIVYSTEFKRIGIKLNVTPLQIAGNTVRLDLNPEVSTVIGYTQPGAQGVSNPIIAVRNVQTTLTMKDGDILAIGGLLKSVDDNIVSKVPLIGDIPLAGALFQSQRKTNAKTMLVFFVRIKILPLENYSNVRFHQPGNGMNQMDNEVSKSLNKTFGITATQPDEPRLRIPGITQD